MYIFSTSNSDTFLSPKLCSKLKMEKFLDDVKSLKSSQKLVKTASFDSSAVSNETLRIFAKALSEMSIKTEIDLGELFKRIFAASNEKSSSREEVIKIASKEIKDSHYQIDLAKDVVSKNGKKMIMVSAYFRDAYLGRYLIKRNFYYLMNNDEAANETFAELNKKMRMIKSNYYDGRSTIKSIATDVHKVLQGVIADFRFEEEDELGTTVKRN